jgi:hypothetical protein
MVTLPMHMGKRPMVQSEITGGLRWPRAIDCLRSGRLHTVSGRFSLRDRLRRLEERDLVAEFGDRYRQYRAQVGMLLPRVGKRANIPVATKTS